MFSPAGCLLSYQKAGVILSCFDYMIIIIMTLLILTAKAGIVKEFCQGIFLLIILSIKSNSAILHHNLISELKLTTYKCVP